jgi:hypothetical protein
MFYAAPNTVVKTVVPCLPWEFKPTEVLTEQIRNNKEDRQNFYKSKGTQHNFYTGIEAVSNTQRVSKDNPPKAIHGFVADYDIQIPPERIVEALKAMTVKPTYFETSLGGNFRLVWVLEIPLQVDSAVFAKFIQQSAHDWLRLDLLPGLDRPAFEEISRLYCNGCAWEKLGDVVPASQSQAFFVECGKKFRFQSGDDACVPLDIVEKALREKYPSFDWPGEFALESQGPSFWIADSVSTQSAIVKEGGLFTFAAHASQPFYSWTDLLGKEFTDKFQADAIAKATEDIWWDGKSFWKREAGVYSALDRAEAESYFRVTCRLSGKPGQSGISQLSEAFEHIFRHQRVTGAAPFVFRPMGLITHDYKRKLNTYSGKALEPSEAGHGNWGPAGDYPFLSLWLDSFFNPVRQLLFYKAWLKHFYLSALNQDPHPGQNSFFLGQAGIGKTLLNRNVSGALVGGYVDASDFLISNITFNAHLFERGLWVIDDESPAGSPQAMNRTHMMFKKIAANQQFLCNAKFLKSEMLEWMGRIGCTANLDFISTRIIGPLDNTSQEKTNLFRCARAVDFVFPDRNEIRKILAAELPGFARHLIEWEPPAEVPRHERYGYEHYHEATLLDQSSQSAPSASFKEIVIEFLAGFFTSNPTEKYWEGTVSMLLNQLVVQGSEFVLRSFKLDQTSRYLEQISREGSLKTEIIKGNHNTRIWRFYRFDHESPTPA